MTQHYCLENRENINIQELWIFGANFWCSKNIYTNLTSFFAHKSKWEFQSINFLRNSWKEVETKLASSNLKLDALSVYVDYWEVWEEFIDTEQKNEFLER